MHGGRNLGTHTLSSKQVHTCACKRVHKCVCKHMTSNYYKNNYVNRVVLWLLLHKNCSTLILKDLFGI